MFFRLFVFQGSSFERKKMVGKGSTSQRIQYPLIKEYTLNYRGLDIKGSWDLWVDDFVRSGVWNSGCGVLAEGEKGKRPKLHN